MPHRWTWPLLLFGALMWFGCPAEDGDDDSANGDDDAADDDAGDDDAADDDAGDDDTGPPEEPYITGRVYDVTCTTAIEGVRVTVCQEDEACKFVDTDAAGVYVLPGLVGGKLGELRVAGHINSEGRYYSGVVTGLDIPDSGYVEAVDTCLPEIPAVLTPESGTQTLDVGDGLELTFDPDDVNWLLEPGQIGAVEVPSGAWQYVQIDGFEVLGAWAMYIWGVTTDVPAAVSVPMRGGIDCGEEITMFLMSSDALGFVSIGPAELDCDAQTVSTGDGEGLTEFSWVVFGRPQS